MSTPLDSHFISLQEELEYRKMKGFNPMRIMSEWSCQGCQKEWNAPAASRCPQCKSEALTKGLTYCVNSARV